jgi:hypothetical protein
VLSLGEDLFAAPGGIPGDAIRRNRNLREVDRKDFAGGE